MVELGSATVIPMVDRMSAGEMTAQAVSPTAELFPALVEDPAVVVVVEVALPQAVTTTANNPIAAALHALLRR